MKLSNITSIIITLLIIAAGIYWYFFTGTGNQPSLTASSPNTPAQTQFQSLFSELNSISFNMNIFSDPHFNSLVDISTPISPESAGRLDPFAVITGGTVATAPTIPTIVPPVATTTNAATTTVTKVKTK